MKDASAGRARTGAALAAASRATGAGAALLGVLGLVGGLGLGPALLHTAWRGAASFVLAGAALWLWQSDRRWARRVAQAAGGAVLGLGILDLAAELTRASPRLEWGEPLWRGLLLGPLLGCALALMDRRAWGVYPAQYLAAAAAWLGFLELLAVLYSGGRLGATPLVALAHLLVPLAALAARPSRGFVGVFVSSGPGGRIARGLFPAVPLLTLVLGWLRLEGERAGWFGDDAGTAAVMALTAGIATVVIVLRGVRLDREETRRLWTLDALRASEERFRALVEHGYDALLLVSAGGIVGYQTPAHTRLLGYAADEGVGRGLADLVHPDDLPAFHRQFARCLSHPDQPVVADARLRHKDGSWREVSATAVNRLDHPAVGAVVVHYRDVTEAKRATATLALHARQQSDVARLGEHALADPEPDVLMHEAAALVMSAVGVDGVAVLERLTGPALLLRAAAGWSEELVGRATVDARPGTHAACALESPRPLLVERLEADQRFASSPLLRYRRAVSCLSAVIRGPEQPWGLLEVHTAAARAFAGEEVDFLESVANVLALALERRRVVDSLRQQTSMLHSIVDSMGDGVAAVDEQGGFLLVNRAGARMTGIGAGDGPSAPGSEAFAFYQPDTLTPCPADRLPLARAARGESSDGVELFVRSPGLAEGVFLSVTARPLTDGQGRRRGAVAVLHDVTERKRAEEALRELNAALAHSVEGIALLDAEARYVSVNDAYARRLGYAAGEMAGMEWTRTTHPDDVQTATRAYEDMRRSGKASVELRGVRQDGTVFRKEETLIANTDREGRFKGHHSLIRDVTERVVLEAQLRQAQKMDAVGRLAGGVAHDFNNLLGVIMGYGNLLLRKLPPEPRLRKQMDEILKAADRAAALTRQLLAFSRKQVLEPRILDLNAVVADVQRMLARLIGEHIEITTVLAPGLARVKADPGQIEQVIVNLAVNSRDAMPDGGRLIIETTDVTLDATYAHDHPWVPPGAYVMLAMSDSGQGMDEDTRRRAFEPFFTTKAAGRGTGLGLATVYGIVKQSGGHVHIYSEPGHGTTVRIYLPQAAGQAARPPRPAPGEPSRGSETLLLVEDEAALRGLIEESLTAAGYRVLIAGSATEAIAIARSHQGRIDAMLTDVIMPGLNGRELARTLAPMQPRMKVLYMSGYTDEAIVQHGVLEPGTAFLSKPFTPEAVLRKLRDVLGRGSPGGAA